MTAQHTGDPVFVDRTGRRRRLFTLTGTAGGLLLGAAVVALLAGFTGAGPAAVPGWDHVTPAPSQSRRVTAAPKPAAHATPDRPAPRPVTRTPSASPPASSVAPSAVPTPTATPSPTRKSRGRGHVPTHTPSHPPKKP